MKPQGKQRPSAACDSAVPKLRSVKRGRARSRCWFFKEKCGGGGSGNAAAAAAAGSSALFSGVKRTIRGTSGLTTQGVYRCGLDSV